jgi:hypothetical protein
MCKEWYNHEITNNEFSELYKYLVSSITSLLKLFYSFSRNTPYQGFTIFVLAPHYWFHISTKQYWHILQKLFICKARNSLYVLEFLLEAADISVELLVK